MNSNASFLVRLVALALVAISVLPACGGGGGTAASEPGLLWNSNSGTASGGTGAPQTLWVDPNSGLGGGTIGALIASSDDITYSTPVVYIDGNTHPLMTSTSSQTIRQAEDLLMQALNGYRSQQLGGGLVGGGGLGGGGITTPPQNAFLVGNDNLSRNARANSKHYSFYHPGPIGNANPEGDSVGTGGVAPAGRLAKCKMTTGGVTQLTVSGQGYSDYNAAAAYFTANFREALVNLQWTHIGCGYWTGGSEQYYWTVILARNPTP
jgi:hypothetical protein